MSFLGAMSPEEELFERHKAEREQSALKSKLKRVSKALSSMRDAIHDVHWAGMSSRDTTDAEELLMKVVTLLEIERGNAMAALKE